MFSLKNHMVKCRRRNTNSWSPGCKADVLMTSPDVLLVQHIKSLRNFAWYLKGTMCQLDETHMTTWKHWYLRWSALGPVSLGILGCYATQDLQRMRMRCWKERSWIKNRNHTLLQCLFLPRLFQIQGICTRIKLWSTRPHTICSHLTGKVVDVDIVHTHHLSIYSEGTYSIYVYIYISSYFGWIAYIACMPLLVPILIRIVCIRWSIMTMIYFILFIPPTLPALLFSQLPKTDIIMWTGCFSAQQDPITFCQLHLWGTSFLLEHLKLKKGYTEITFFPFCGLMIIHDYGPLR